MSLSIRNWLAERNIKLAQLGSSAQIAGIAFRLAQDMEVKSLNAFALSALTDVLELPLITARTAAPAISQLTIGLLRILSRKKPLKRNEGTWLTFQVAYLNALQGILEQEARVGRPWINRALVPAGLDADLLADPQLIAVLKTLRPGRLSDSQAEQALSLVADSFLVQQMNNLAREWFVANGAEEMEAKLLTQRLNNGLAGYLLCAIAENPLPLAQLQKFVRLGNLSNLRETPSVNNPDLSNATIPLNLDREYYRASLMLALGEPLLGERFSLKDLYIPLQGKLLRQTQDWEVGTQNRVYLSQTPVDLMEWAMSQLEDKTSIAVIEADPGSGKTSFCQIWAARVAQDLYPNWMPVVIRLKDIELGQTFAQTLDSAFPLARFPDSDGWLSLQSPPLLLILDGLDELPHPHSSRRLWQFMEQMAQFHASNSSVKGLQRHKIVITSCRATLDDLIRRYQQSLIRYLPSQLQRLEIEPIKQDEFRQWFQNWAKLQSKAIAQGYFNFLRHGGVFKQSRDANDLAVLLKRPLMLYLVGLLHRDAWIDETIFLLCGAELRFEIYDRICHWLLGEPATQSGGLPELIREGLAHAGRSQEAIANLLEGLPPQALRQKMQVVALKIVQTGQYQPALVADQLFKTKVLPALFFRSKLPQVQNQKFASGEKQSLTLEFSHPSLGEYLAAEAIAAQLQAITEQVKDQYGEVRFAINSLKEVAAHLYSLLGYGLLSPQIENLLIECLCRTQKRNSSAFSFSVLFQRLEHFYRAYCWGRWFDESIPQLAYSQLPASERSLNVLQIDAAVGLNVFLLLCATAREAQVPFLPCGNPDLAEFDQDQLVRFINRITALSPTAFWQRTRHSLMGVQLSEACLNQIMLAEANLAQANLSKAELIGINLAGTNLQNANLYLANLSGANLTNANLAGARLEGADLKGANLQGANLTSANLTNTCVFETLLDEPSKSFATRSGAIFSRKDFQTYTESLAPTQILNYLDDEDDLEGEPTIFIESAEGELILPDYPESDEDGDDGETAQIENIEQETAIAYNVRPPSTDLDETIRVSNL
jgi:Pentapeptide repeats (8 copies)/NACHT domain